MGNEQVIMLEERVHARRTARHVILNAVAFLLQLDPKEPGTSGSPDGLESLIKRIGEFDKMGESYHRGMSAAAPAGLADLSDAWQNAAACLSGAVGAVHDAMVLEERYLKEDPNLPFIRMNAFPSIEAAQRAALVEVSQMVDTDIFVELEKRGVSEWVSETPNGQTYMRQYVDKDSVSSTWKTAISGAGVCYRPDTIATFEDCTGDTTSGLGRMRCSRRLLVHLVMREKLYAK